MHVKFYIYVDAINCLYFVTQKAISKKIINLDAEEVVFAVKIIDLDVEVFTKKRMMVFVFMIYSSNIYTKIASINQNTMILL